MRLPAPPHTTPIDLGKRTGLGNRMQTIHTYTTYTEKLPLPHNRTRDVRTFKPIVLTPR